MHLPLRFSWFYFFLAFSVTSFGQLKTGAEQLDQYLPDLENKKVALLVNQTSVINNTHLADTLIALGVDVIKIFAPEHGFRGNADAGEHVKDGVDKKTGVVRDDKHDMFQKSLKDSILVFPHGIGSSVGAYTIYSLKSNGTAPAAMICAKADLSVASGCALANIPLVIASQDYYDSLKDGEEITVDTESKKFL